MAIPLAQQLQDKSLHDNSDKDHPLLKDDGEYQEKKISWTAMVDKRQREMIRSL